MKKYIIKRFALIAVSVGMFTTLSATTTKSPRLAIKIPPPGNNGNTTETDDDIPSLSRQPSTPITTDNSVNYVNNCIKDIKEKNPVNTDKAIDNFLNNSIHTIADFLECEEHTNSTQKTNYDVNQQ